VSVYEDTVARVRVIIGEMSPLRLPEVESQQCLVDELGYESISFMELALALEAEFNLFSFDEEKAGEMVTVGDVEKLIGDLVVAAAS
jgi:acyl carrier protein